MYAYKQPEYRQNLHVVPRKKKVVLKRVQKKKKQNPIVELFRFSVVMAFLAAFVYFVFPTAYNRLIKQVFMPDTVQINTHATKNLAQ